MQSDNIVTKGSKFN